MIHHYLVTENHPEIEKRDIELPVIRDPYSNCYLRQEAKGLIIPGGFPEEFAEEISQCKRSLSSLKDFYLKHPIYAECGGMLILGEKIKFKFLMDS